jgi:hypothetical protein
MAIHSKLSVVKLQEADTSAGDLTVISTYCNKFEQPRELDLLDVTTFGATSKQYLSGFADGTVTMGGPWTRALDGIMSPLFAAFKAGTISSVAFEYGPEGADSGDVKYTGNIIMTNYSGPVADAGNAQEWEAEFQVTGDVSVTTYSA